MAGSRVRGQPPRLPVLGKAPDHAATAALPQHGFARTSRWEFLGKSRRRLGHAGDGGEGQQCEARLGLSQSNLDEASERREEAWPYAFGLIYSVTLGREGCGRRAWWCGTERESAWQFQVLLHTYFRVNVSSCRLIHMEEGRLLIKLLCIRHLPSFHHRS